VILAAHHIASEVTQHDTLAAAADVHAQHVALLGEDPGPIKLSGLLTLSLTCSTLLQPVDFVSGFPLLFSHRTYPSMYRRAATVSGL
jgi:hypothetical protein